MPLSTGTSKEARQKNIEREIEAGKDPKQAVAIGYAQQRENRSKKDDTEKEKESSTSSAMKKYIADACKIIRSL